MAYTPMQQWKTTYSPSEAMQRGTVFPELYLPFEGGMRI
ncbi:MAG: spore coat associated protein CotJA [Firmicutes bacterium]|nr:spore coat associated protein CotJA [Bacillota bacterium]